LNLVVCK